MVRSPHRHAGTKVANQLQDQGCLGEQKVQIAILPWLAHDRHVSNDLIVNSAGRFKARKAYHSALPQFM
jgi:hypothetical protein